MNINSFFYSIELTYYSTSFLFEVMFNRLGFNINSIYAHVYEHMCSPNNDSKNHLNNYFLCR